MSVPIIHARSRIAVTFTAAPPIESSTVPRLRRTLDRSSAPAPEAISIPVTAVPKMTRMVNTARGAGGEVQAGQRPADEAAEAQDPDDEALAVPGHREGGREDQQHHVEHVTGHGSPRYPAMPAAAPDTGRQAPHGVSSVRGRPARSRRAAR